MMKRQEQQVTLKKIFYSFLVCLLFIGCSRSIDQEKFNNVNRATKAVQGAIMTGVNYMKFSELLQNMGTEILIIKDKLRTEKEKELLKQYVDVYEMYKDSLDVWNKKIQASNEFELAHYTKDRDLLPYAKKYNVEIFRPSHDDVIQTIWRKASERIQKIGSLAKAG